MRYFVTSDVHSYFNELMTALNEKGFEIDNKEHKLVVCGDLFDRGDATVPLFDFIKELSGQDRLIYIRGNHEDLLFECVDEIACGRVPNQYHFNNGTVKTICMFCGQCEWIVYDVEWRKKIVEIMAPILEFIDKYTIDYFKIRDFIFVHGWIPCDSDDPNMFHAKRKMRFNPNWDDSTIEGYKFKWVEARWTNGMSAWLQNVKISGTTIVCGHWHCNWGHAYIHKTCSEWGEDAIFEPFIDEGIIAIDACTAHSGKVNVMVIEE